MKERTPFEMDKLQEELSICMVLMEKLLPTPKSTEEVEIPKEDSKSKFRKIRKTTPKEASPNQEGSIENAENTVPIMIQDQKLPQELNSEANDETKPVEEPQPSCSTTTELSTKRSRRNKAPVNYHDLLVKPKILYNTDHKSFPKSRARRTLNANRVKKTSTPKLKSILKSENAAKGKNPNLKIKKNISWSQAFRDFVKSSLSRLPKSRGKCEKILENYVSEPDKINHAMNMQTQIENKSILTDNQQNIFRNQLYVSPNQQNMYNEQAKLYQQYKHDISQFNLNPTELLNYYSLNPLPKSSELAHHSQENLVNINFENKNLVKQDNSLCDSKNVESIYFENGCKKALIIENLNTVTNITTETAPILFPYWVDNIPPKNDLTVLSDNDVETLLQSSEQIANNSFPIVTATESNFESIQINDNQEKYVIPYAMDAPMNLDAAQLIQNNHYDYSSTANNNLLPDFNTFAKWAPWHSNFVDYQSDISATMNNDNLASLELSSSYKHEPFGYDFFKAIHFNNCSGEVNANTFEIWENQHFCKNFCAFKSPVAKKIDFSNVNEIATPDYDHCRNCKIGFLNYARYCMHMMKHGIPIPLCDKCGLFIGINFFRRHESQCE